MDPSLFKQICDQLSKYYPTTRLGLGFTEPLIYKHLEESINYARSKNIRTSITTNGFALPETAEMLSFDNCQQLNLSIDGPLECHNATRGHGKAFQNAMNGLDKVFGLHEFPEVSIFCLITSLNFNRLHEFADSLRPYPIKHLGFLHMNFITSAMAEEHNKLWGDQYPVSDSNLTIAGLDNIDLLLLEKEILSVKAAAFPFTTGFSPNLSTESQLNTYYKFHHEKIGKRCMDVFSNLMVRVDGSVIPAHARCYCAPLGNIATSTLPALWNSSPMKALRRNLANSGGLLPACTRCCSSFGG